MATNPASYPMPPGVPAFLDHAPSPMATVEGTAHSVCYVNAAFCRLVDKTSDELVGKPLIGMLAELDECLPTLDRIHRTGKPESHIVQGRLGLRSDFLSYTMWPLRMDEHTAGVMIQVIETAPLYEKAVAMSEALMLGALRQHELTEAARASNSDLQEEIGERKQRERDALMLTREVSHRITNSLQIIVALTAREITRAAAPCVEGYRAIQARIVAIAELYDLMSQSSRGSSVPVGAYLGGIVRAISASLLGDTSGIKIEIKADALDIDAVRALPFGLLANELVTNAIKHAFPDAVGRVVLTVERAGDEIEFTVADNGVGLTDKSSARVADTHGTDYVAVFARQLGGTITVIGPEGAGTTARVRLPSLLASPTMPTA
jgi:two-component sensor histidine kinase